MPRPERPVRVAPEWVRWQDGTAGRVAEAPARERAEGPFGALAAALEDAGCSDDAILSHLRSRRPHAPGCWALRLVTPE